MNMSLFKLLTYLLKFKEIAIIDTEIFNNLFFLLDMLSVNYYSTPALNNLRRESNKSLCILINKKAQSIPEVDELVEKRLKELNDIILSNAEELDQTTKTIISEAFYLIKGLAIKGSPLSYQAIQKIIENLKSTSDEIRA